MRELFRRLNVFAVLARIERKIDRIMAQDDDLTAAVSALTASVSAEAADISTLLAGSPAANDPAVADAITRLDALKASVDSQDATIKAKLPEPPAPAPVPASEPAPATEAAPAAPAADAPAPAAETPAT